MRAPAGELDPLVQAMQAASAPTAEPAASPAEVLGHPAVVAHAAALHAAGPHTLERLGDMGWASWWACRSARPGGPGLARTP